MPIDNLGKSHLDEVEIAQIFKALQLVAGLLQPHAVNLTAAQRSKYGKVGMQYEMLIDKVREYHLESPHLKAPEVNWAEFDLDYADRKVLSMIQSLAATIELQLLNMKVLRDHDNLTDALRDYKYSKYKNENANIAGFEGKVGSLKVFFPKTGKRKK